MVLSTEWSQVEVIDLINDGSGLGFGIVGGRSTGVVVKSILPGGIADKGRRLQSGDHILQIGGVNLKGLGSEQVAVVLRQAGAHVRMVVARPIEITSANLQEFVPTAPIVPTKILCDPEEIDKLLSQNGYMQFSNFSHFDAYENQMTLQQGSSECLTNCVIIDGIIRNSEVASINRLNNYKDCDIEAPTENNFQLFEDLPETECFTVELKKHKEFGLGITVAGYICEREDLNGIFIRSVSADSDAYRCNKIKINDRIVGVDDEPLENCTNYEAIEKLKKAGEIVKISFERYLRGPKYDHLQEALLHNQENKDASPPSPTTTTLSWIPINTEINIEAEGESIASVNSEVLENNNNEEQEVFIDENFQAESLDILEESVKQKWQKQVNSDSDIVVLHLRKLTGLGISLEGTVEVEDGIEQNPRHFIRSILPEGPVGQSGKLRPGDEILEVNGQKLIGVNHVEAVKVLRNLPSAVRLVCARKNQGNRVINTSQNLKAFEQRNILGGSLKNLIVQNGPKQLVKALSDTSINNSSHTNTNNNNTNNNSNGSATTITPEPTLQKTKSRSLENTNVAMWSDEVEYIDLIKGDKGLGFSILDYQDPVDTAATIIVVRTLVPGGVAETNGKIQPGDCLISVNGTELKNMALDQAVQALKGTMPGPVRLGIAKPLLPNLQQQ
ncbi:patj homolog [Agrilus planipennis]|uniref:Patj homolog n=1 Tax=Agrilus planipennis TaxID=224129 RepID=A0A1W4XMX9_AGRPL|nr:patj homolog [Agrilus planipennis]